MISLPALDELGLAALMTLYHHHEYGLRLVYVLVLWLYKADSMPLLQINLPACSRSGSRTSSHQANCTCVRVRTNGIHTRKYSMDPIDDRLQD